MTREGALAVAIPLDDERRLLVDDICSAAARAADAEPGDRLDVVRFETLSSQLEAWVFSQTGRKDVTTIRLGDPPSTGPAVITGGDLPSWVPTERRKDVQSVIDGDGALVLITLPLEPGEPPSPACAAEAPPPAERWKSKTGRRGRKAVEERFEFQLERATSAVSEPEPFSPSGIQNRVLTQWLRKYVNATQGTRRVDVPVEYRDGSRAAHPFPLRSVRLLSKPSAAAKVELSFSLLSIRHAELDPIVDGAWLRNSQVSQTRTEAETDDLVYGISREQLQALTNRGTRSLALRIYQTGLQPAIVGFYRAVTNHLIEHPGSLNVIPMYYQQPIVVRPSQARRGKSPNPKDRRPTATAPEPDSERDAAYSAGDPWTTSRPRKA